MKFLSSTRALWLNTEPDVLWQSRQWQRTWDAVRYYAYAGGEL